jgi:outer membrane immunogenic protein
MKKLTLALASTAAFLSAPALAADLGRMPAKAPVTAIAPPAPVYWNGFYVGAQFGYGWGNDHTQEFATATGLPTGFDRGFDSSGIVGGVHAGYNHQIGAFVLGIEGDFEGSGNSGGFTVGAPVAAGGIGAAAGNGTDFNSRWQASLRGRVGYATGRTLIYATGGAAFADLGYSYFTPAVRETFRSTETGWTAGAGIEWAFAPAWSTRLEYRYTDFGQITNSSTVAFPGSTFQHDPNFHTVRLGVSYRFGGGPVAASY